MKETRDYFRHLELVRENIREEFYLLGIPGSLPRICDFGCGDGLTTFGLALEADGSECIGVDLFSDKKEPTLETLQHQIEVIRCGQSPGNVFPDVLHRLAQQDRLPKFQRGNIVLSQNLPQNLDLAYCKKVLVNLLFGKATNDTPSSEDGLLAGLGNIVRCIRPGGLLCVIEYSNAEFVFEKYLVNPLRIVKQHRITRREIRSRGRTSVINEFMLYLCRKDD